MAVTLNKANLVLKDANGNIGKIEQLSSNDLAKIKTAVSDVALVVNQSNHTPIEATTTNKGVVQLATSADVVSGASDKVVTAEQLHNSTTGTSALATENLARIDAVVTEAGIPIDHTNTNQLKTAVTTLISNAVPATATSDTVGVVKPDGSTITIDSNGVLTATAQMPGVATSATVGVVKPDGNTITVDGNGTLTATAQMPGVATASTVGVVKPDGSTITVDGDGTLTATAQMPGVATTYSVGVVQPDGRTITITADGVISAIGSGVGSYRLIYWETDYFDIAPSGLYSFDLSNTDFANISKDAINIQMVGKVKTDERGFKVGDYVYPQFANLNFNGNNEVGSTPYISGNVLSICFGNDLWFVDATPNGPTMGLHKTNVKVKLILTALIEEV